MLLRALRDGVDPAGRTLSATMPRYAIADADAKALGAYLRALGAEPPPGVDEAIVHIATILTPQVSAARRSSMLEVLRTFIRAKNGGTRYETRRRTKGPWDMKQQYQGYRDWVLDEWELQRRARGMAGPARRAVPETAGLRHRRRDRGRGLVADRCVLAAPQDPDHPPPDAAAARVPAGDGFYSLYFSKGVTLEAQTIAHHLGAATPLPNVRQVARCGTAGQAAAVTLAREFKPAAARSECVPSSTTLNAETWRTRDRRCQHPGVVARRRRDGGPRCSGRLEGARTT